MSDEAEQAKIDEADSVPAIVESSIGDLVTGIPAPIRKNAVRAFGQLCTAAIQYPLTLIENAVAEKRAESQARVALVNASAKHIADQLQIDPEFVRAASNKFAQKIVRERVNVDKISQIAADELRAEAVTNKANQASDAPSISEDWLNVFEGEAAQMTSEQMQSLFGKILAGEIRRPSSYSIKAVRLLAQIDNRAASLFQLLCSLSISLRNVVTNEVYDARVVSIGNAASNSLLPYGLGFSDLNILNEYGLIISDYNSYVGYQVAIVRENKVAIPITYQNARWALAPKDSSSVPKEFRVDGVALSQVGKELLPIVDVHSNPSYTLALQEHFSTRGMKMCIVNPR